MKNDTKNAWFNVIQFQRCHIKCHKFYAEKSLFRCGCQTILPLASGLEVKRDHPLNFKWNYTKLRYVTRIKHTKASQNASLCSKNQPGPTTNIFNIKVITLALAQGRLKLITGNGNWLKISIFFGQRGAVENKMHFYLNKSVVNGNVGTKLARTDYQINFIFGPISHFKVSLNRKNAI